MKSSPFSVLTALNDDQKSPLDDVTIQVPYPAGRRLERPSERPESSMNLSN